MADNYVAIPICVVKAYAEAAITAGDLISASDTGFISAASAGLAFSAMAYSPAAGSDTFALMICGVGLFKTGGAVNAGEGVQYSAADKVVAASDTALHKRYVGTCLDFAADSNTSRTTRVWLNGFGHCTTDSANS
jgi:hypothetical protein